METKEKTEIEILSELLKETKLLNAKSQRIALNTAFLFWATLITVVLCGISAFMSAKNG